MGLHPDFLSRRQLLKLHVKGRTPATLALRCVGLISVFGLSGCQQMIVLHPKGVVGEGTTSLLNGSLIIMLPIVVPTILAALIFGWW